MDEDDTFNALKRLPIRDTMGLVFSHSVFQGSDYTAYNEEEIRRILLEFKTGWEYEDFIKQFSVHHFKR